ncbi:hypothetical protein I7I50_07351 [Histoplasma capsulatum G186AR]|uniref:Uncharacterized protein n=1 Tax=Ajellomyces capsulatus TaxID=5037 RepID=A0A8H8D4B8_AJECA|nr:hypothetical protein I7I52_09577 [Histoplasma capsulatum]QSS68066.1 hypothetical protein I7I50_07351 [Histoplasma capsulatum G186AR]
MSSANTPCCNHSSSKPTTSPKYSLFTPRNRFLTITAPSLPIVNQTPKLSRMQSHKISQTSPST